MKDTNQLEQAIIRPTNTRDFLALCDIYIEKKQVGKMSRWEKEKRRFVNNILADLGFFLCQYQKILFEEFSTPRKSVYIANKIQQLVDSIESDLEYFGPKLLDCLETECSDELFTVVYVLASVDIGEETPLWLPKALSAFAGSDEKERQSYIDALTLASHPNLDNGLTLVKEMADPEIKEACQFILSARQNLRTQNQKHLCS